MAVMTGHHPGTSRAHSFLHMLCGRSKVRACLGRPVLIRLYVQCSASAITWRIGAVHSHILAGDTLTLQWCSMFGALSSAHHEWLEPPLS
jgi:hypothetical protein